MRPPPGLLCCCRAHLRSFALICAHLRSFALLRRPSAAPCALGPAPNDRLPALPPRVTTGDGRAQDFTSVMDGSTPKSEFSRSVVTRLAPDMPFKPRELTDLLRTAQLMANGKDMGVAPLDDVVEQKTKLGLSDDEAAEAFANAVNALLIPVVDDALDARGDDATFESIEGLLDFMDSAANIFEEIAGSAAIDPVKYNGRAKKSALEALYKLYIERTIGGADGYMGLAGLGEEGADAGARAEALQIVLGIKTGRANRIAEQAVQRLMQDMMNDPEKAMEAMQAAMDPSKTQEVLETLKAMVKDTPSKEDLAQIREMLDMMKGMGTDVDQMLRETEQNKDNLTPQEAELADVLRKLVALLDADGKPQDAAPQQQAPPSAPSSSIPSTSAIPQYPPQDSIPPQDQIPPRG